jgi:aspartate/methionine/tyrosine aminotransferase
MRNCPTFVLFFLDRQFLFYLYSPHQKTGCRNSEEGEMKERISSCVKNLGLSVIREMGLRAAKYENVIGLEIGEPDFDTPATICKAAAEEALSGRTHYTPSQGDPELIDELSHYVKRHQGIDLKPAQIIITHGGQGALVAALRTLLDEGDQVIMPEPYFPSYLAHVTYMGGEVVRIPTRFEDGFILRPEAIERAITPRSKVLLLNSPNNPTGAVIPGATLDEIARLAVDHNLLVVSDEVYDRFFNDTATTEIYTRPGMAERTVVVNSFSKSFAMTGWRVGYTYGPPWIMEEAVKAVSYYTVCASSVGQRAAVIALRTKPDEFVAMAEEYKKRSEFVYKRLSEMAGIRVNQPRGAFYVFPDISEVASDGKQFALELLDKERVVVVPGSAFGSSGESCVRLACTVDMDRLGEALDKIERFTRDMKR